MKELNFESHLFKMMHQEILQELSSLWTVAVRERDEASERLRHSLVEISQLQKLFNNILLSDEQQVAHFYYQEAKGEIQNCSYSRFSSNSPSRFSVASPLDFISSPSGYSSPAISVSGSYSSSLNQNRSDVQKGRDFETVVLEMIGGTMPENGKFVRAVIEAGPLLESLIMTGPIPKWRNPPVQVSGQIPVSSNYGYSNTGNWIYDGLELGSGVLNRCFPCKKARFSLMS